MDTSSTKWRDMMGRWVHAIPAITCGLCLAAGYAVATWRHDLASQEARYRNYTDRARICVEAAALLRANRSVTARKLLEAHADAAIAGVGMWRTYEELGPDSKALMVSAMLYDRSFDDVDFDLNKRVDGKVPDDHPWLSANMRGIAAKMGG